MDIPAEVTSKEVEMIEHMMKPKGVEGFWGDVQIFMKYLYEKYPHDMREMELEALAARESAKNEFAASSGLSFRRLVLIPDMLIRMLDSIYEDGYPVEWKKFQQGFWKRYTKLRVAERY